MGPEPEPPPPHAEALRKGRSALVKPCSPTTLAPCKVWPEPALVLCREGEVGLAFEIHWEGSFLHSLLLSPPKMKTVVEIEKWCSVKGLKTF